MSGAALYLVAAAAVFGIGAYGLLIARHVLRKLLALNMMSSAIFLLLVTLGRDAASVDPVPQALVLTGIVVAVSATAFASILLVRLFAETGSASLDEAGSDGG
jgi:multicomponent Na+:H+ antiporter subunit C